MHPRLWPLALHLMAIEGTILHLSYRPKVAITRANANPATYPYVRATSSRTPIWKWMETRFKPVFPDLNVRLISSDGCWLKTDSFMRDAYDSVASLWQENLEFTLYSDTMSYELIELGQQIRRKFDTSLVTAVNEEHSIFGFFRSNDLSVEVRNRRVFPCTDRVLRQKLDDFATRHGLSVEDVWTTPSTYPSIPAPPLGS